jgi:multisubunit Na+/H+ antiporter MnhB subunit
LKPYDIALKALAAGFSILFLVIILIQLPTIIPFQYSPTGTAFVITPGNALLEWMSNILWNQRVVETLGEVIVLFVAAAGAAALFRLEKPESIESETEEAGQ